ncbi:N-alpha-acetyltransferase 60 isoform X1 [Euwallacea fornicatus]|uniref:N-alpha-acetyltransferase 60 isoform X1 n=1 Tax=Euwallacea fornicatus TaxID=995702 RepID=UPI00338F4971
MADISWYKSNGDRKDSYSSMSEREVILHSLAEVQLRFLCPDDLDEVRALCQEWFPIEYPFYWYEEITSSNRVNSLNAFKLKSLIYSLLNNDAPHYSLYKKQIIGLIVAEIIPHSRLHEEDAGILAKSFSDCDIAYILSLGVLKKYRRNGIATLLLDSLLKNLTTPERKKVKAAFLHVLTTNSAAIRFYEKRKFKLHTFLPYYYSIKGRCKDGFMYVLYLNEGHPPWTLYDYIKCMCGRVMKGAGFFPWVLFNINKALGWLWGEHHESATQDHH